MSRKIDESNLRAFKLAFCQVYCGKKLVESCDNADCKNKKITVNTAGDIKLKDMIEVKK